MGELSIDFKSKISDLLKIFGSLNGFIIFLSLINLSVCIYEDQVGKFDWRQSYVGRIKFAQFDTVSTAKKIIVATEENVIAALHLKTGQIVWRHVLENTPSGNIQLLHVSNHVLTVSGSNPYLVRGWKSSTGTLLWEWSISLNTARPELSQWLVHQNLLYHVLPAPGAHLEVTAYQVTTGLHRGATSKLPAVWVNDGCVLSPPYFTCLSGAPGSQLLLSMDVTSDAVQIISKPVSAYVNPETFDGIIRPLDTAAAPGFVLDDKVLLVKGNQFEVVKTDAVEGASVGVVDTPSGPIVVQTWQDEKGFNLMSSDPEGAAVPAAPAQPEGPPEPELVAGLCARAAREPYVCRYVVNGADDSVALVQQEGRVLWSREEALANVVAAEFIDLPVSAQDAAIEAEFDQKEGSIWSSFARRLHTQLALLAGAEAERGALTRDYFNMHKVIFVVTDVGAMFGIDNESGAVLWRRYRAGLDTGRALVFVRRTARHAPLDAVVTVVARSEDTGNALIIDMNPITGEETWSVLGDAPPLQAALAPRAAAAAAVAPLLVLSRDLSVQVYPPEAARDVRDVFLYVAETQPAAARGFVLQYDGQRVTAKQTWSVSLGAGARLAAAAATDAAPRSPARVLGDRSVLYKYCNPNLLLFIAETPRTRDRESAVTATALDAVTGAVVAAHTAGRARAAPHAVLSEHFFAYAYYSEKHRRTEIVSVELYEGGARRHAAGAAVSAFERRGAAAAARAAYVLPAALAAAALTVTERGLTDRHVLLALSTGSIVELPWAYLDPRRPTEPAPEHREEGLLPYAPALPLPPDAALNYNRSLARVARLRTAPAGLESTCLVLATGLDMFYTRVAPSKTFDLLKEDFDYYLITVVLAALVAATYGTKYFAAKKQLKMAWK